jgi:hypothetical protein
VLIELIIAVFVAIYVLIVALGHALLVIAIYKCMRKDGIGGYRRRPPGFAIDDGGRHQATGKRFAPSKSYASLVRMLTRRSS